MIPFIEIGKEMSYYDGAYGRRVELELHAGVADELLEGDSLRVTFRGEYPPSLVPGLVSRHLLQTL